MRNQATLRAKNRHIDGANFFPKNPSHIKGFVYQCGTGRF